MLLIKEPTILRLLELPTEAINKLEKKLTYTDKTATYIYNQFKHNTWYAKKYGVEQYNEELLILKNRQKICLLKEDNKGLYTYSGLLPLISSVLPDEVVKNEVEYPSRGNIPWHQVPDFTLRYYQKEAITALLQNKHAAVELAMGTGKSKVILQLCKELGLKTIIITPSTNIANQLYNEFIKYFGKKYVGKFWGGKKDSTKIFTISIDDSLLKIQKDSDDWNNLSKVQVLISDEAHTSAAATIQYISLSIFKNTPYRFYLSGTPTRNDGSELLLDGIIGPIVYNFDSYKAINEQFLAKPEFKIIKVKSNSNFNSNNPLQIVKQHYYYNNELNNIASNIINNYLSLNKKILILIDEIDQFNKLLPLLNTRPVFAHGPINKAQKSLLPPEFHESDVMALVDGFNNGLYSVLVGTSCISIGTDTQTPEVVVLMQSGRSEIKVKQSVGRGLRRTSTKDKVIIIDFDVYNIPMLHNHSKERIKIYDEIYPNIRYIY